MAADLLSRLVQTVLSDLGLSIDVLYAWTDSSIVLTWIRGSASSLKTFVANRVRTIQDLVPRAKWKHVRSAENPADLASRGLKPQSLIENKLWWSGPVWLRRSPDTWPSPLPLPSFSTSALEKKATACRISAAPPETYNLWERYSSFNRLLRVTAWMKRFANNARQHADSRVTAKPITAKELENAKVTLLLVSQKEAYQEIFESAKENKPTVVPSSLRHFDVSIEEDGLIHVAGRVRDLQSPRQAHSVILLSLKSVLCKLLLVTLHDTLSHPGVATLISIVAEGYHVPGIRNFLKHLGRSCINCCRLHAQSSAQKMGLLPLSRTTPAPPFHISGINFTGPFLIHRGNPRKPTRVKVYAAVLVCFVTKAVHFDLCSDLSSDAFIAALQRFCGRRGTPRTIHSDNGSNFIGTKKELDEVRAVLTDVHTTQALSHLSTTTGLEWKFSPPRAPHFGGLWESAVKSMKTTLRKLLSSRPLSFEELYTLLVEAESILNSRPLSPVTSTDPDQAKS